MGRQAAANDNGGATGGSPAASCPICGKPPTLSYRPFCSKRCADIDLHRWMTSGYVICNSNSELDEAEPLKGEPND